YTAPCQTPDLRYLRRRGKCEGHLGRASRGVRVAPCLLPQYGERAAEEPGYHHVWGIN
ncbi:hypothetical protein DPEC_G00268610, partial [Dallia pectoralis]